MHIDIKHASFRLYDGPRDIPQKKYKDLLYLAEQFLPPAKQAYYRSLTSDAALDSPDEEESDEESEEEDEQ